MTWLTWRQFRAQAIVAGTVLAVAATVLLISGLQLTHLYATSGIPGCQPQNTCAAKATDFINSLKILTGGDAVYFAGVVAVYFAPALIGIFWGAPLITRELETGSFRLAWTQSVTRNRWLATKLGLVALASMATAGLLSLMVTWWAAPIDEAARMANSSALLTDRFGPVLFGARGVVPIGYAAFAFVLGVTVGVVMRRMLAAMAVTLTVFTVVQVSVLTWVRPHLMAPLKAVVPLDMTNLDSVLFHGSQMSVTGFTHLPGALVVANGTADAAGQAFTPQITAACLSTTASRQQCDASIAALHLRQLVLYQPASRYWTFQWLEAGIYVGMAVLLAGFCFYRLSRRAGR